MVTINETRALSPTKTVHWDGIHMTITDGLLAEGRMTFTPDEQIELVGFLEDMSHKYMN